MGVKKKDGQYYETRRSNHKYFQLDDLDVIRELRKKYSRGEVAEMLGVPVNSLRHREVEELADCLHEFVFKRSRHQNRIITK